MKSRRNSLELKTATKSDGEVEVTEHIGDAADATYIKVKILRAMKSPNPHEGLEYCRQLHEEVKRFSANEHETGQQFNSIKANCRCLLKALFV